MARVAVTGFFGVLLLACVAAVPVQLQGAPNSLKHDEYMPDAMTEILARYLEDRRYGGPGKRNLDHIGGGNLLRSLEDFNSNEENRYSRNLDHIGGGNLLRQLGDQTHPLHNSLFARNLDHIGGGNLLRSLQEENRFSRNLDQIGGAVEPRNFDGIAANRLLRQSRRGLDSLSGATFGESKRLVAPRRIPSTNNRPGNFDEIDRTAFDRFVKRNIDEIDRTAFDSFFKRNFDEIDRVGWSDFAKRLDNYLADRQRR